MNGKPPFLAELQHRNMQPFENLSAAIAGTETPRAKSRPLAPGRSGITAQHSPPADRLRVIPDGHHGQLTSMRPLA